MSTGAGLPEARALLVVESVFGNTAAIGRAIAEGLSEHATVDVVAVDAAPRDVPEGVGLLVVGAPTHAFSLSRANSREDARARRDLDRASAASDSDGQPGTTSRSGSHDDGEPTAARSPDADVTDEDRGLRDWLGMLSRRAGGVAAACFDTKLAKPRLPGSAASAAAKRLRRGGFRVVVRPRSFYVSGTAGPLVDGELERAREWGRQVGAASLRLESPR